MSIVVPAVFLLRHAAAQQYRAVHYAARLSPMHMAEYIQRFVTISVCSRLFKVTKGQDSNTRASTSRMKCVRSKHLWHGLE